jgi:cyclophilin family peptidyl-prolyl cis-trans isomerase
LAKKKKSHQAKQSQAKHRQAKLARKWPARNYLIIIGVVIILIVAGYFGFQYFTKSNDTSAKPPTTSSSNQPQSSTKDSNSLQWSNPPPMSINQNKEYLATIKTNYGDISVRLFPKEAPLTVNNFVFLANQGFYDNLKFHRIMKDFVIQTGDPRGNGTGGPGYKFADEKITRDYVKGTLAMANSGPNTNGSQFFITLADLKTVLPKNYTIFGEVIGGQDVVQKIGSVAVKASLTGENSVPTVDVVMTGVTITEK